MTVRRLLDWWRLRSAREQRLLAVMGALVVVVLAWLLMVRPLGDALADARLRHAEAVIGAARAAAAAAEIAALERTRPKRTSLPVAARVAAVSAEAGLVLARTVPQSDGVAVTIDAVRPAAFFAWIGRLERGEGLIVDRLTARANGDRTLAVELTVRGRRG